MSDKKKKVRWTPYATAALLDVWPRYAYQLRGNKKNQLVFCALSQKMQKRDVDVNAREVRSKINNMIQKYREVKRKVDSGKASSDWQYFDAVHAIMKSYSSPKNVDESDIDDDEDNTTMLEKYLDNAEVAGPLSPNQMFITSKSSTAQSPSQSSHEGATSSFAPFHGLKFSPTTQVLGSSALFHALTSMSTPAIAGPSAQIKKQHSTNKSTLSSHSSSDTSSSQSMSSQVRKSSPRRQRGTNLSIQWQLLNEFRNMNKIMANELKECRKASQQMLLLEAELVDSTIQFQNEFMEYFKEK